MPITLAEDDFSAQPAEQKSVEQLIAEYPQLLLDVMYASSQLADTTIEFTTVGTDPISRKEVQIRFDRPYPRFVTGRPPYILYRMPLKINGLSEDRVRDAAAVLSGLLSYVVTNQDE